MKELQLVGLGLLMALSAVSSAQRRVVLGKEGETIAPTYIYSSPSRHARVISPVKAYTMVVVRNSDNPDWRMVLLGDRRSFGYVPAEAIAEMPFTVYMKPSVRVNDVGSRSRSEMARYALNFQGTPYEWGGNDLQNGIDCSGFVKKMAGAIGMNLPRTAAEQAFVGTPIYRYEDLRAGDRLYFWEKARGKIGHTGIYLGRGYFIHSSHGKGGVATDYLSNGWRKILVAARR